MSQKNSRKTFGDLKIFFSYAEGTGKTVRMLESALKMKNEGMDVVIGYISTPISEKESELLAKFECLGLWAEGHRSEFDLDQALSRKPTLLILDELAHSNRDGCRHRKRFQDVAELLKNGIHVYTTVSVSNIESLQDTVFSITGKISGNRIPDTVFDKAKQVEFVDAEPQELIRQTYSRNEKYKDITIEQLTALREIALRRLAERVRYLHEGLYSSNNYHTEEHILACLSSAPSNARIIRTAARMANAFNSRFTALFVETPDYVNISDENRQRLKENQQLAEELGAEIEIVYGEDVPYQIAEFARLSGITKIVLGRSAVTGNRFFRKRPLTEQLIAYVPEMDIHIIPDISSDTSVLKTGFGRYSGKKIAGDTIKSAGILTGATFLSMMFARMGFTEPNIIMVYILGVLLTSVATSHLVFSLASSVASVFIFNYLFTIPRFTFTAYGTGYPVTFVIMFLTAFFTGTFAIRYKGQAGQAAKLAYRTQILFDTNQLLAKVKSEEEILSITAEQIIRLLKRDVVIYGVRDEKIAEPIFFSANQENGFAYDTEKESEAVNWVIKNNHSAGATTDTLSDVKFLYFALRVNERIYGVIGVDAQKGALDAFENGIFLSIIGESALALENRKNMREKEEAAVLAESEQLRANLLRTISHDLRTPLTTISGNAANLLSNGNDFSEETKHRIYSDIHADALWLNNLVENLLFATKIEDGKMILKTSVELLNDIVEEAVIYTRRQAKGHEIILEENSELILVRADARLIVQVLVNLIDNAVKYTATGSSVRVAFEKKGNMAKISVSDSGPGIPDEEKTKIFDKFYCGTNKIADNRRSIGLGLYLSKAIVEAHGGTIRVSDQPDGGAVFTFSLIMEEVAFRE